MPPKVKLHKTTGKSVSKVNSSSAEASADTNSVEVNPESQQQFEAELCWCIQQLQRTLNSGKVNPKQVQESTKILNSLMSNSTPFIKKRQLMRITFGDYRSKMAEEDSKHSKAATNIKIAPVTANKKSQFMRKSAQHSSISDKNNFNIKNSLDDANDLTENVLSLDIKESSSSSKSFCFSRSDNMFRFNFQTELK